jgi:signal transduction histidine kinase
MIEISEPTVGELAAAAAHDLNNALLVIRGYSSMLSGTLDDPQQLADVSEIAQAAERAAQLTRRLLALASPSTTAHGLDGPVASA